MKSKSLYQMKCNSGSKNTFLPELFQNNLGTKQEPDLKLSAWSPPKLYSTRSNYCIINPGYNKTLLISFKHCRKHWEGSHESVCNWQTNGICICNHRRQSLGHLHMQCNELSVLWLLSMIVVSGTYLIGCSYGRRPIGPSHNWSNHMVWNKLYWDANTAIWEFQNKGKSRWTGTSSFVLEVPLCYLRLSIIYSVPRDRIMHRAYQVTK